MTGTAGTERAAALHAAGMAAAEGGRMGLARRRLRAVLRLAGAAPDGDRMAWGEVRGRALVTLAWVESERGDIGCGLRLVDEAEAALPAPVRPLANAQRAVLLIRNGHHDRARSEFDAAVDGFNERDTPLELSKVLGNRGILNFETGRAAAGRQDLTRAIRIASQHGFGRLLARTLMNLGCLEEHVGDLPAALRTFAAARAQFELSAPSMLMTFGLEEARALVSAGLFRDAEAQLAVAARNARDQRLSHTYAEVLRLRATAALMQGSAHSAAEWAGQARRLFLARRNPRQAALCALVGVRADFTAGDRRWRELAARAERLAAGLHELSLPDDARVAALVAARCRVRTGQRPVAEELMHRYGTPGRLDRLDTRLLWRLTLAELDAAVRPAAAARQLAAGMAILHRHRVQLGSFDLRTGAAVHGLEIARAGLRSAVEGGRLATVYRWTERARAQASLLPPVRPPDDPALAELRLARYELREAELDGRPTRELRAKAERLQRTVRQRAWSTEGGGRIAARPAPLAAVRAELGDAALISYFADATALQALLITAGSTKLVRLGELRLVDEAVQRLRADLDAQAGRTMSSRLAAAVVAATRHDAAALAALVLDPLMPLIGGRDLIVVPTGLLMTTPWPLLPGCGARPITVAPSATAWLAARHSVGGGAGAILVSGPGTDRGDQEVHAIAGLYPGSTVLTGAAATPDAALGALDGAGIAHFAAHGRHQVENALFSSLELAGGPMLGHDLQHLSRPPALFVLSCCELGLTDVRPGDESVGMASALLAAGAATVVASVSRVDDEAAMTVMVEFHRSIAAGLSPARALAEAVAPGHLAAGFVCFGAG